MSKLKFKIGISYLILVIVCIFYGQFLLLINYSLALFLHELAHFYVARSKGYRISNIKLDLLGMKLTINQNVDKNDQFLISLAGPVLNFVLCVICCALWWIVPESFYFTSNFFQANFMLTVFNILPVEPLDGGVILRSLLSKKSRKSARLISKTIDIVFIVLFAILFFISCDKEPNLMFLMFAIFFAVNLAKSKKREEYDLYYKMLFKRNEPISKMIMLKVEAETTLFDCFKSLKQSNYTVFYYPANNSHYITETELQMLLSKYDLKATMKEVFKD